MWVGLSLGLFLFEKVLPALMTATASFFPLRSLGSKCEWPPLWNRGVFPLFNRIFKPDSAPSKTWKEEKILSVPSSFKLENKQPGCQVPRFSPTSSEVPEILRSKLNTLISVKIQEGITHTFYFVIRSLWDTDRFFSLFSPGDHPWIRCQILISTILEWVKRNLKWKANQNNRFFCLLLPPSHSRHTHTPPELWAGKRLAWERKNRVSRGKCPCTYPQPTPCPSYPIVQGTWEKSGPGSSHPAWDFWHVEALPMLSLPLTPGNRVVEMVAWPLQVLESLQKPLGSSSLPRGLEMTTVFHGSQVKLKK